MATQENLKRPKLKATQTFGLTDYEAVAEAMPELLAYLGCNPVVRGSQVIADCTKHGSTDGIDKLIGKNYGSGSWRAQCLHETCDCRHPEGKGIRTLDLARRLDPVQFPPWEQPIETARRIHRALRIPWLHQQLTPEELALKAVEKAARDAQVAAEAARLVKVAESLPEALQALRRGELDLLTAKLDPNWRDEARRRSRIDLGWAQDWRNYLSCLYELHRLIWLGAHRKHEHTEPRIMTLAAWIEAYSSGEAYCPNHAREDLPKKDEYRQNWYPGAPALLGPEGGRRIENMDFAGMVYRLVEIDAIFAGREPANEEEAELQKALSWVAYGLMAKFWKLRVVALIDTGGKSLHCVFASWDKDPRVAEIAALFGAKAPVRVVDSGPLTNRTNPFRLPGTVHDKTLRSAELLYLNPLTNEERNYFAAWAAKTENPHPSRKGEGSEIEEVNS